MIACLLNFIMFFGHLIVEFLIKCFNETYGRKEISNSHRRSIISVLSRSGKEGKDRIYLENWRPISLKILQRKVNSNQAGYVSGRYIGILKKTKIVRTL